jgi:hypothetical protein
MNAAAAFVVRLILPRLIATLKEEKVLAYAFYMGAASFCCCRSSKVARCWP